jgi:DNA-binding PadR family transcriptional regulator
VTAARLLILGVLRAEQPAYGYEIRRELKSWGAERWASVAPGSIYHALNKMAQEGLVERVETDESSKGPARNTYVITERGEREFQRLLREFLWQKKPTIDPLQAALAFLNAVPKDELAAVLKHRAASARATAQALQYANESISQSLPPHFVEGHFLGALHAEAEAQWAEEALKKVERDELP